MTCSLERLDTLRRDQPAIVKPPPGGFFLGVRFRATLEAMRMNPARSASPHGRIAMGFSLRRSRHPARQDRPCRRAPPPVSRQTNPPPWWICLPGHRWWCAPARAFLPRWVSRPARTEARLCTPMRTGGSSGVHAHRLERRAESHTQEKTTRRWFNNCRLLPAEGFPRPSSEQVVFSISATHLGLADRQ